jgi:hypothetical protein
MNNQNRGYDIGDVAQITLYVRNSAGTLIDPTTITCTVQPPTGVAVSYTVIGSGEGEIVKNAVGDYEVRHPAALAGRYRYRWVTTGTGAGAEEGTFTVRRTTFTT